MINTFRNDILFYKCLFSFIVSLKLATKIRPLLLLIVKVRFRYIICKIVDGIIIASIFVIDQYNPTRLILNENVVRQYIVVAKHQTIFFNQFHVASQ